MRTGTRNGLQQRAGELIFHLLLQNPEHRARARASSESGTALNHFPEPWSRQVNHPPGPPAGHPPGKTAPDWL